MSLTLGQSEDYINRIENKRMLPSMLVFLNICKYLLIAVIGISFAVFNFTGIGSKQNSVTTGTLVMTYTENTNGISITNAMPMTDIARKVSTNSNEKFKFTVSASITGTAVIN